MIAGDREHLRSMLLLPFIAADAPGASLTLNKVISDVRMLRHLLVVTRQLLTESVRV